MITVKEIPPEAWSQLEQLFYEECHGSPLPDPENATFLGVYDDSALKGFVLTEKVTFIGQMFTVADGNPQYAKALVNHLCETYPEGNPVAATASEPRFESLYRSLGMNRVNGILYRRD